MKVKFFVRASRGRRYAPLCHCLQQRHPLLQSYHFKSQGYGPVYFYNL